MGKNVFKKELNLCDSIEMATIMKLVYKALCLSCSFSPEAETYKLYETDGNQERLVKKVFKSTHLEETFSYTNISDSGFFNIIGTRTIKNENGIEETLFYILEEPKNLNGNFYSIIIKNKYRHYCYKTLYRFDMFPTFLSSRIVDNSEIEQMKKVLEKQNES